MNKKMIGKLVGVLFFLEALFMLKLPHLWVDSPDRYVLNGIHEISRCV